MMQQALGKIHAKELKQCQVSADKPPERFSEAPGGRYHQGAFEEMQQFYRERSQRSPVAEGFDFEPPPREVSGSARRYTKAPEEMQEAAQKIRSRQIVTLHDDVLASGEHFTAEKTGAPRRMQQSSSMRSARHSGEQQDPYSRSKRVPEQRASREKENSYRSSQKEKRQSRASRVTRGESFLTTATSPGSPGNIRIFRPEEPRAAGDYANMEMHLAEAKNWTSPRKYWQFVKNRRVHDLPPDSSHPLQNPEENEVDRKFVRSIPGYTGFIPAMRGESVNAMSHGALTRKAAELVDSKMRHEMPASTTSATFTSSALTPPEPNIFHHIHGYGGHIPRMRDFDKMGATRDRCIEGCIEQRRNLEKLHPEPTKIQPHAGVKNMSPGWMGNQGHYRRPGTTPSRTHFGEDSDIHFQALQDFQDLQDFEFAAMKEAAVQDREEVVMAVKRPTTYGAASTFWHQRRHDY